MEIVRVIKNTDYTTISNKIFKNKEISLKAKGMLAMLLSFSDQWELTIRGLEAILKEGRDAIRSTLNELIKFGYIERIKIREKGKIVGYQYTVYEIPNSGKPFTVKPTTENPTQINNNIINKKLNKEQYKEEFKKEVFGFNYPNELLKEFYEYWTEETKRGVLKKDTQKTWATSRRLKTWAKNENKWHNTSNSMNKIHHHIATNLKAKELLKNSR